MLLLLLLLLLLSSSNLAISDDLQGLLAPEESPNWKNQFACSGKTLYLEISRP